MTGVPRPALAAGAAATAALCAVVGVTLQHASAADEPQAAATAAPDTSGAAPLRPGAATVDESADQEVEPVEPRTAQSQEGAVRAFASYASWLVGSPATAKDPTAGDDVGDHLVVPDEAAALAQALAGPRSTFHADRGAYRVLAFSGDAGRPDGVMVEVAAPLSSDAGTRWTVIGGVVTWSDDDWELTSVRQRATQQPKDEVSDASDLSASDRQRVLDGAGWSTFDGGAS